MNIILIILAVMGIPFVIAFFVGMFMAARGGSGKKRSALAITRLSQLSQEQINLLRKLNDAYKNKRVEEANYLINNASVSDIDKLVNFFSLENRPPSYNSGTTLWTAFNNTLKDNGYCDQAAKIIPLMILDNYNDVLSKMRSL